MGEEAVLADSGRAGEKTGLFAHPAGICLCNPACSARRFRGGSKRLTRNLRQDSKPSRQRNDRVHLVRNRELVIPSDRRTLRKGSIFAGQPPCWKVVYKLHLSLWKPRPKSFTFMSPKRVGSHSVNGLHRSVISRLVQRSECGWIESV